LDYSPEDVEPDIDVGMVW